MTYHSTLLYYSQINAHIQQRAGGVTAASLILHSFNFADIAALFGSGKWDAAADKFISAAKHMKAAGATGLAIGCNIGHKVAAQVSAGAGLPVLHIASFTAKAVKERSLSKVALLATKAAMEGDFISGPLRDAGIEVLIPSRQDHDAIDAAIFDELAVGKVTDDTKAMMYRVVDELVEQGAQGVVLACTDLQFVLKPEHVKVPLLDTLEIHTQGLADWALQE
jgi:aspartate racemase